MTITLLEFGAEVSLFMAAISGLALAWRGGDAWFGSRDRRWFALAFAILAIVALAHGSGAIEAEAFLVLSRSLGAILLAAAAIACSTDAEERATLLVGAFLVEVGGLLTLAEDERAGYGVIFVGALVVGTALGLAGRRSLTVRLRSSVGGVTLATILAIALSIAMVATRRIEDTVTDDVGSLLVEDLLVVLFVVAVAAACAAVIAVGLIADRVGEGLVSLAEAVDRIGHGDLDADPGTTGRDEVATIGRSIGRMGAAIRTMTGDLRKAAQREAGLRTRLEAVIASMADGLVVTDTANVVTDCNDAAGELLGGAAAEIRGRPLTDVLWFTPADGDGPIEVTAPDSGFVVWEGSLDGPDGEDLAVMLTVAPLRDADGVRSGSVLAIRDVRREQQADRMKDDFLANISHELRTPLTPIKGYASVLGRRPLEHAQVKDFAREITAGVDNVDRVIGRLVSFATVAAGRLQLERTPQRAGDIVRDAAARWQRRLGEVWTVAVQVADGDTLVLVDRTYLDQALDELIDNAVKYSPESDRITVGCALHNPGGGRRTRLRLVVADTGMGMDPERLEELLIAFAQGDSSATRRFGGLGLGLALVERIGRAHGARLECESAEGQGSRLSIMLAVAEGASADG